MDILFLAIMLSLSACASQQIPPIESSENIKIVEGEATADGSPSGAGGEHITEQHQKTHNS